jgi:hypothetical protein
MWDTHGLCICVCLLCGYGRKAGAAPLVLLCGCLKHSMHSQQGIKN